MRHHNEAQAQAATRHALAGHTPASPEVVDRLLAAMRARDIRISADTLAPTASARITGFAGLDLSSEEAQVEADLALGRGTDAGRDRCAKFSPPDRPPLEERINLADRIRKALDGDLLRLFCQPVVSVQTRSIAQWELLVRLVHTEGWLLPPASFLAAAERFGLAERLDAWVMSRAIELLRHQESADPELRLEVNVSARSLSSRAFVERLEAEISSSGISPGRLIIGIPPLVTPAQIAAGAGFGERLAGLGCRFALDNFGTGPTALVLLAELPVDCVKIDGRIVRHLTADARNQALVKGIAQLVGGLGIRSVAMDVANEATVELLRDCGVDYGQGWHLGKPLPLTELP